MLTEACLRRYLVAESHRMVVLANHQVKGACCCNARVGSVVEFHLSSGRVLLVLTNKAHRLFPTAAIARQADY